MNREENHIIDELQKRPAEVPGEDYFAQLKADMLAKVGEEGALRLPPLEGDRKGGKVVSLHRKTWLRIAAAAGVALIVTLFVVNGGKEPGTPVAQTEKPDWNSISQEEVLAYIHENIDDFETEAIAERLDSIPQWSLGEELAANTSAVAPKTPKKQTDEYDELFREIDREDILEYLEDEGELDEELLF